MELFDVEALEASVHQREGRPDDADLFRGERRAELLGRGCQPPAHDRKQRVLQWAVVKLAGQIDHAVPPGSPRDSEQRLGVLEGELPVFDELDQTTNPAVV